MWVIPAVKWWLRLLSCQVPATAAVDAMGTGVDDLLSSEEHYKKNHNLYMILVAMCHGLKNEDNSGFVDFDKNPWASLKVSTYRPSLAKFKNELGEDPRS